MEEIVMRGRREDLGGMRGRSEREVEGMYEEAVWVVLKTGKGRM